MAAADRAAERTAADANGASQERWKRELGVFLLELTRQQPLILFLDDIHWADPSSIDLLAYLGGRCAGMRVLLVLTYRPSELIPDRHPFGPVQLDLQARGVCREVAVPFLSRDDIRRYLGTAFAGHHFPEELTATLHDRTEGNPLFVVDLLRYLCDRGVIVRSEDGWTLAKAVPDLRRELPESVRGMVRRKVDQLEAADRHLLTAASVQGPEFDSAVVAEILGWDAVDVEERLDILDRVHFMVRNIREQTFPDRTLTMRYGFVHVLYQNALYGALQPSRKATWSAAAARALLAHHGEKSAALAAELAVLFAAARDHDRAAVQYLIAAENAVRVFAHHEAVALARLGLAQLELLPDSPGRARRELPLQATLGIQLQVVQGYASPAAEHAYDRARELCDRVENDPSMFLVLWGLWMVYEVRSYHGKSRELAEKLLALARQSGDQSHLIQAHMALTVTNFSLGELAVSRENADQGVELYDPIRHAGHTHLYGQDPKAGCLAFASVSLWLLGYPDRAIDYSRRAVALAAELGHPTTRALALYFAEIVRYYCRDVPGVQVGVRATTAIATEHRLSLWLANSLLMGGWASAEQGDIAQGIAMLRQGLIDWAATGAETHRTYFLGLLAEALGRAGQVEDALEVLAEAIGQMGQTGTAFHEAELHRLRGVFLLRRRGNAARDEAETSFRQALAIARRQQSRSLELRAAISLTRLYHAQGRQAEVRPILVECYDRFTEGFDTPDLLDAKEIIEKTS
jgi:predicted ATPase